MTYEIESVEGDIKQQVLLDVGDYEVRLMQKKCFWGFDDDVAPVVRAVKKDSGNYLMRAPVGFAVAGYPDWFYFFFRGRLYRLRMRGYQYLVFVGEMPPECSREAFEQELRAAFAVHCRYGHKFGREQQFEIFPSFDQE